MTTTLQILRHIDEVPSQLSFLEAAQAQLHQPFLIRETLQSLAQPCHRSLDWLLFCRSNSSPSLSHSSYDAAFKWEPALNPNYFLPSHYPVFLVDKMIILSFVWRC